MLAIDDIEDPVEGVPEVFAKIPSGGQALQEKLPGWIPLFRVLLRFY
jgi:hypothetical protein